MYFEEVYDTKHVYLRGHRHDFIWTGAKYRGASDSAAHGEAVAVDASRWYSHNAGPLGEFPGELSS